MAKVILKKMAHTFIQYLSQFRGIFFIAGVGNGSYIYYCQSKGLSDERISSITASNYNITLNLNYYGTKTRVKFYGSCLNQDEVTFNHE